MWSCHRNATRGPDEGREGWHRGDEGREGWHRGGDRERPKSKLGVTSKEKGRRQAGCTCHARPRPPTPGQRRAGSPTHRLRRRSPGG